MTIEEIRDYINGKEYYGNLDGFLEDNFDNMKFEYVETLKSDDHRWYIVEYNVYFVRGIDNLPIGYICIEEVGTLKSESMDISDCYYDIKAHSVKEIVKKSYEIID